jgi:mRNA interferase HicA
MEIDTFRKWLAERGCHFDTQRHQRGDGQGHLTIHREGRIAELPLTGSHHHLDADAVRQVCETLGLNEMELPGPKGHA